MDHKKIVMNFSVSPSLEDMEVIAAGAFELLPEEILEFCEDLEVNIEDFPEDVLLSELDIDDPYELLGFYKSGKEISPGVEKKEADEDDVLVLFRRPILDVWCERGEDLGAVVRQVMIEEIGTNFDFSEEEIEEMTERHYQGLL